MFGRLLLQLLRGSRGRLVVALIALASGAAVISTLVNLDFDVERKLTQEFRTLGANVVVLSTQSAPSEIATTSGAPMAPTEPLLIDESVLTTIAQNRVPQLGAFAPFLYIVGQLGTGTHRVPIVIAGTWLDQIERLSPSWSFVGERIASRDDRRHCLIGRAVARQLSLSPGGEVDVKYGGGSVSLVIAGIFNAGSDEDNQILVSLAVVQQLADLPDKIELVQLNVSGSTQEIESYAQRLSSLLPSAQVRPVRQIAETEGKLLARIRLLIFSMIVLILALTALCVLGTMAALAMERREDVGLMKALGGSISQIVGLFMAEAGVLGAAGGVIGYIVGIGLTVWLGRKVFDASLSPPWEVFPLTVGLMTVVALAGASPLRLLGKVKPASILRGES